MKKEVLLPILKFWLFNVVIPIILVVLLSKLGLITLPHLLYYFVLFVSPFIFIIITFRQVKKRVKRPWVIIVVFLVIPYIFIYFFTVYAIIKAFENFGF